MRLVIRAENLAERTFAHLDHPHEVSQRGERLLVSANYYFLFLPESHVTVIIRGFCGDAIRREAGVGAAQPEAKFLRLARYILWRLMKHIRTVKMMPFFMRNTYLIVVVVIRETPEFFLVDLRRGDAARNQLGLRRKFTRLGAKGRILLTKLIIGVDGI